MLSKEKFLHLWDFMNEIAKTYFPFIHFNEFLTALDMMLLTVSVTSFCKALAPEVVQGQSWARENP